MACTLQSGGARRVLPAGIFSRERRERADDGWRTLALAPARAQFCPSWLNAPRGAANCDVTEFAQESAFAVVILDPRRSPDRRGAGRLGYFVLATRKIAAHAERLVPPSGKFIEIDGNRIHYVEAGEGRPIVFIHGLGAQFHQFRHPLFGRLADSYRLVALDRPGSGYSVRAPAPARASASRRASSSRFIDRLGLEKPLLVGHSLGGMVALAIAIEHPGQTVGARAAGAADPLQRQGRAGIRAAPHRGTLAALADLADHRDPECVEVGAGDARFHLRPAACAGRLSDRRRRLFGVEAEPFLRDIERSRRAGEDMKRLDRALWRDQGSGRHPVRLGRPGAVAQGARAGDEGQDCRPRSRDARRHRPHAAIRRHRPGRRLHPPHRGEGVREVAVRPSPGSKKRGLGRSRRPLRQSIVARIPHPLAMGPALDRAGEYPVPACLADRRSRPCRR